MKKPIAWGYRYICLSGIFASAISFGSDEAMKHQIVSFFFSKFVKNLTLIMPKIEIELPNKPDKLD